MATELNPKLVELFKQHYGNPVFTAGEDAGILNKLGVGLYNTGGTRAYLESQMAKLPEESWTPETLEKLKNNLKVNAKNPFSVKTNRSTKTIAEDGTEKIIKHNPLKDSLGVLGQNIKAHPYQAIGTGLNAAGNVAGLVDNDKFFGQLGGTVGGALLGSKVLGLKGLGTTNAAMIGGNIGALFDALRAKKEREQQEAMMYQQQYV